MRKIFGISLVAILAVTPLMASAAVGDVVSTGTTPTTIGTQPVSTAAAVTAGVAASDDPYYSLATEGENDDVAASAGYVKGAYNAAIKAINKVHAEAAAAADAASSAFSSAGPGLARSDNVVELKAGDGIKADANGTHVNITTTNAGLKFDTATANGMTVKTLNVKAGDGITTDTNGVKVDLTSNKGLEFNGSTAGSKTLGVKAGNGIEVGSGGVAVKAKTSGGITVDSNGVSLTNGIKAATNTTTYTGTGLTTQGYVDEKVAVATDGMVTADSTTTFTNKTINAEGTGNSITNLKTSNFKSGTIVTSVGTTGSDTALPTEKAVRTAITNATTNAATKEGVAATVNKATATASNASLGVNFGTITTNTSALKVSVPTKANYKIMKTWGSDSATDATYALGTNTNASVTGTAITTIGASTATGTVNSTVSVPGYYENASDTTAETFTTQG